MSPNNHPIKNLTAQLKKHNAFSKDNLGKISTFFGKLILQEPFRILEEVNHSKAISNHELQKDPIFIIGHWRSGTSFLQYLLGKDPQFGYLTKFQAVFPDVFLHSESFLKTLLNRIPETINLVRDAQNMSVNLELDSPSEIEIALTTMISQTSLHWGHIFPQDAWYYFNKYLFLETADENEIQQWKRDYTYLINKISLKNNGKQLLVKSPGNSCRMERLLEMYPNARFIFIHRNPYDLFYSSKKLWNTLLDNLALQDFSKRQMEETIIEVYAKFMSSYLEQRSQVPDQQLVEIRFDHFIDEPVAVLDTVYQKLALPGFKQARPHVQKFLSNKTEGESSSYEYEKHIINKLNTNWKFAFEEWNYSIINSRKKEVGRI